MKRIFPIINRINSVLLLCSFIAITVAIAWDTTSSWRHSRQDGVAAQEKSTPATPPITMDFNMLEDVRGSDTGMLQLTSANRESASFSSDDTHDQQLRNILFVSSEPGKQHWLFKDHKNLLISITQQNEDPADCYSNSCPAHPTRIIQIEYVDTDTDQDDRLTATDRHNIGVVRPDGSGFTDVLRGIDSVLNAKMNDAKRLSIIYKKEGKVRFARIATDSLKTESDQELVGVPKNLD